MKLLPIAYFVALAVAAYLTALHFTNADAICFAGGCSEWYREGPLSRIGPVPLSAIGVGFWILYPIALARWPKQAGYACAAIAIANVALILVGFGLVRSVCIWCVLHASAAIAITLCRQKSFSLTVPAFALIFGLGMGYTSPQRTVVDQDIARRVHEMPRAEVLRASTPLIQARSGATEMLAIVDLNCGHCAKWLSRAMSEEAVPKRTLRVAWAPINGTETTGARDGNQLADSIAGDLPRLRAYLAKGVISNVTPTRGDPDRRRSADELYRRLHLTSVPVFLLLKEDPRRLSSFEAYEELFGVR